MSELWTMATILKSEHAIGQKPHEKSHLHKKKVSNSTLSLADDESQM